MATLGSRMPKMPRWCHALVLIAVMVSGCAHTQLSIYGAGEGAENHPVRVTQRSPVSLLFRTDRVDSTKISLGDGFERAQVRILESDGSHLLLKSKQWKTVTDVPSTYLKVKDVYVTARHAKYNCPTVRIPLSAVEEISLYTNHRHLPDLGSRGGSVPRWALKGASFGFVTLLTFLAESGLEDVSSEDALKVGVVGALGGAILNTGYHLLRPEVELFVRNYRSNSGDRWEYREAR